MKACGWASGWVWVCVLALGAMVGGTGRTQAGLVINCVPQVPLGVAPVMTGGGNLPDIMNAAAGYWMAAFPNVDWTVDVKYQWGGVGAGFNAQFRDPVMLEGHIRSGDIYFNNSTVSWYADPDPLDIVSPAFGPLTTSHEEFNGHQVTTGLAWDAVVDGPAYGRLDLLTIAKHEMGHALGIYAPPATEQDIVVSPEVYPELAGFGVRLDPMLDHIDSITTVIMASGLHQPDGLRKGITAADILAIAQINGWQNPNLNPYPVPEPSSLALLAMGIALLARYRSGRFPVASLRRARGWRTP